MNHGDTETQSWTRRAAVRRPRGGRTAGTQAADRPCACVPAVHPPRVRWPAQPATERRVSACSVRSDLRDSVFSVVGIRGRDHGV